MGESARLDRLVEAEIRATRAASRRETLKVVGNIAINLAIILGSFWMFVESGNPLSLALPGASLIGSIVITVRRDRRSRKDGGR